MDFRIVKIGRGSVDWRRAGRHCVGTSAALARGPAIDFWQLPHCPL